MVRGAISRIVVDNDTQGPKTGQAGIEGKDCQ
jgi:hypothetical protein